MQKTKPTILLIYGGRGVERDVSVMSASYLFSLIDSEEFVTIPVFISERGSWLKTDRIFHPTQSEENSLSEVHLGILDGRGGIFEGQRFIPVDAAFPMLHGDFGEDGVVQGALSCAKINFVGPDVYSGSLTMDKAYTKIIAERLGIPTARFVLGIEGSSHYSASEALSRAEEEFGYPMFIKPARLGSSIGASRADNRESATLAYDAAKLYSDRVLIEELVDIDKEVECGYFKVKNKEIITDLAEISCSFGFYDYERKYFCESGASLCTQAEVDEKIREAVKQYSKLLAEYLGIRHLSRIDFFITREGRVVFNEINAIPGFTSSSMYPLLIKEAGLDPHLAVSLMIKDATGLC